LFRKFINSQKIEKKNRFFQILDFDEKITPGAPPYWCAGGNLGGIYYKPAG
jgi:hypothetical protein